MALIHVPGTRPERSGRTAPRRRSAWLFAGVAVLMIAASVVNAGTASASVGPAHDSPGAAQRDFGPNVKIFDPTMPISEIQATVDAISSQQIGNEMGTQRYALLFKPGTYGTAAHPLIFQVGYYTEVARLG